jgi:hypothetical protein
VGELFASSAAQDRTAWRYLPHFAEKSRNYPGGWGLGFFRDGRALIEKSSESLYTGDQVHDGFLRLARVVDSRLIISQISGPQAGQPKESLVLPWSAQFLHHHWLFSFRGDSRKVLAYQAPRPLLPEALSSAAARVLEFIRDGMEAQMQLWPDENLYQALALTCKRLITDFPGDYLFFLANETVLFVFLNQGEVLLHQPPEARGETLVLTTVSGGLTGDPDQWLTFANADRSRGQLLIISGGDLLYQGHL